MTMGNRILFVGSHPYEIAPLTTIARRVREQTSFDVVFASVAPDDVATYVYARLHAEGYETLPFPVLVPPNDRTRDPLRRARRWRDANRAVVDRVVDELRPAAVLACVNPPPSIFLDGIARRGVPAVLLQLWFWGDREFLRTWQRDDRRVQHAAWTPRQRLHHAVARGAERLYGIPRHRVWNVRHATAAVQGPALRRQLVADGVAPDRVVVTGNPVLDDLHRLGADAGTAGRTVRAALGIPDDREIVTHFRSHEDRMLTVDADVRARAQAEVIRSTFAAVPDAAMVVKIHPKEGDAERRMIRSIDERVIVAGDEVDTTQLIAASSLCVGTFSTTLLQSVALDRPTVSALLWPGLDYWRRATDWSGVERVTSADGLTDAIRRQLLDPAWRATWAERRAAFRDDQFALDGKGTERVTELLVSRVGAPAMRS